VQACEYLVASEIHVNDASPFEACAEVIQNLSRQLSAWAESCPKVRTAVPLACISIAAARRRAAPPPPPPLPPPPVAAAAKHRIERPPLTHHPNPTPLVLQKKPSAAELRALGKLPKLSVVLAKVEEIAAAALSDYETNPGCASVIAALTEAAALAITASSGYAAAVATTQASDDT
jgi:hypothetical protein